MITKACLPKYLIDYVQWLDILRAISYDEKACILQVDSRDDLVLHVEHTLSAKSTNGVQIEELVEGIVSFVQTIAHTLLLVATIAHSYQSFKASTLYWGASIPWTRVFGAQILCCGSRLGCHHHKPNAYYFPIIT